MFNISQFLGRIRNIQTKGAVQRLIIRDVLQQKLGMTVPIEHITLKSLTITLKNLSSSSKSLIYIKKQILLDEINKNQETIIAKDIK